MNSLLILALTACAVSDGPASDGHESNEHDYFAIEVVDQQTGRGIPAVELRTVNNVRFVTDSNGLVAFLEPGLMGRRVFFHLQSHGYEFPKDGFGYRGKALQVEPGGHAKLAMKRINIAERLYRMTGAGIYRDSVLLGRPTPIRRPVLNGLVLGSDSVVNTIYRGKLYWFWGDTNRPGYPLGNFHVPGATSLLPADGGLDPAKGVDLSYFAADDEFARPMAKMPGDGPTWIDALVTLQDDDGREQMFAKYVKVKKWLQVYERGLVRFDDRKQRFEKISQWDMDLPLWPRGHPLKHSVDGTPYVYFADPYPLLRVRATVEDYQNPASYEALTCLKRGSRLDRPELDRDAEGLLRYRWKPDTPIVGPKEQAKLIEAGLIKPSEALLRLRDHKSGKPILAHRGSVYWNEYRNRWIMITVESGGTSPLGEVWFAESDAPEGPWLEAVKIATHRQYSFYNPKQHPMFDQHAGRVIYFEGTYTHTFSGNPDQTPRYDYNQIMYRLDLADPRLGLPVSRSQEGS